MRYVECELDKWIDWCCRRCTEPARQWCSEMSSFGVI